MTLNTEMTQAERVAAEETEALALEGYAHIGDDERELAIEYLLINKEMNQLKARKEAIKELLTEVMSKQGVRGLTYDDLVVVELIATTKVNKDFKSIERDYPEIAAMYITKEPNTAFSVKKDLTIGVVK